MFNTTFIETVLPLIFDSVSGFSISSIDAKSPYDSTSTKYAYKITIKFAVQGSTLNTAAIGVANGDSFPVVIGKLSKAIQQQLDA